MNAGWGEPARPNAYPPTSVHRCSRPNQGRVQGGNLPEERDAMNHRTSPVPPCLDGRKGGGRKGDIGCRPGRLTSDGGDHLLPSRGPLKVGSIYDWKINLRLRRAVELHKRLIGRVPCPRGTCCSEGSRRKKTNTLRTSDIGPEHEPDHPVPRMVHEMLILHARTDG
jgi:hypothetical protein